MSLCESLEADIETNVPAQKIHDLFSSSTLAQLSSMSPKIQGVDLLEGEWGKAGSIVRWRYTSDGVSKATKDVIEDIDNVNLSSTFKVIEGDFTEAYKTFKFIFKAIPKGQGSIVRSTLMYEKLSENIPAPTKLLEVLVVFFRDVNAYLTQAQT